jgi:catechol 2,3-dioxygenase
VQDVAEIEKFFMDCTGMWATERVRTSLEDDAHTIATWLTIGESNHDIALLEAPENKIHHFAFEMRGWNDILHAADIFSMDDVPIDIGPTRHGITRGTTIYFFDPAGNRNETFSGGYRCFRDRPVVTWTPDQLGKAIFYHSRELNERFLTVAT